MKTAIIISNQFHHYKAAKRLGPGLKKHSATDLVSFCEFRRQRTPEDASDYFTAVKRIIPRMLFGSSKNLGAGSLGHGFSGKRKLLHWFLSVFLAPIIFFRLLGYSKIVLFNDNAFPNTLTIKIARLLRARILLIQEGIRFMTPIEAKAIDRLYGTSELDAILVWGDYFKRYFTEIRKSEQGIYVTGCISQEVAEAASYSGGEAILIATNPIDDLGYCTTADKLELVRKLVSAIRSADRAVKILIKNHPRENTSVYREMCKDFTEVTVLDSTLTMAAALRLADRCICFASTAGLEAIQAGKVLGVVKVGNWDYAFNYIAEGGGYPIDLSSARCPEMMAAFLEATYGEHEQSYLDKMFYKPDDLTECFVETISSI